MTSTSQRRAVRLHAIVVVVLELQVVEPDSGSEQTHEAQKRVGTEPLLVTKELHGVHHLPEDRLCLPKGRVDVLWVHGIIEQTHVCLFEDKNGHHFCYLLRLGKHHTKSSVKLLNDRALRNSFTTFILIDNSDLLIYQSGQLLLSQTLCLAGLLQSNPKVMTDMLVSKHLCLIFKLLRIGRNACVLVGCASSLLNLDLLTIPSSLIDELRISGPCASRRSLGPNDLIPILRGLLHGFLK